MGSTFLPSIFGAMAGVGGYEWMPYFAMGICAMMAVLFNIQKKIVETKSKPTEPRKHATERVFLTEQKKK